MPQSTKHFDRTDAVKDNAALSGPLRDDFSVSKVWQEKSHRLIPGGCHTYAKGDDQFPVLAPGFIVRGEGSHVWDVDGHEYIEYGMGCRAVTLGHAFPSVVAAAQAAMLDGSNFTRPATIEVEAAEEFLSVIRGADMVKFCKDGSTATTAALKLARAHTGRDKIAFCQDHPFFAIHDWFIGSTAFDAGIPQSVKDLSLTFRYNDIDSVKSLFKEHPDEIAAIILEPAKYGDPEDQFLHKAQELCRQHGAVFILDEMITGFRWDIGGAQAYYSIVPDLSTFGKALANGFSVSALAGKKELMELGGLLHDKPRAFLLSTTHGAESHSLAAMIETIRVYKREPVIETLHRQGQRLVDGLQEAIRQHDLQDYVSVVGKPCCLVSVARDIEKQSSQAFRTLLLQETIRRGVIMPSLVVSYSHSNDDIDWTINAIDESFHVYRKALDEGVDKYLIGRPSKSVYRKYN
jgi:glutamate-1-semialdehyde 2,1-aminomutase